MVARSRARLRQGRSLEAHEPHRRLARLRRRAQRRRPPGEVAMHDAKKLLHEVEKQLEGGQVGDAEAKIAQATVIMNKAPSDARVNWARVQFDMAISILKTKITLAPRVAKPRSTFKAVADLTTQPKPDPKALASAADACVQAFKDAEAQANLTLQFELTTGKARRCATTWQSARRPRRAAAATPWRRPSPVRPRPDDTGKACGHRHRQQARRRRQKGGSDGGCHAPSGSKAQRRSQEGLESHADAFLSTMAILVPRARPRPASGATAAKSSSSRATNWPKNSHAMSLPDKFPAVTVDCIIELPDHPLHRPESPAFVLIERRFPPLGWAAGGLSMSANRSRWRRCAKRWRRPASSTSSSASSCSPTPPRAATRAGTPSRPCSSAAPTARRAPPTTPRTCCFTKADTLPALAFDHAQVLGDYFEWRRSGKASARRALTHRRNSNATSLRWPVAGSREAQLFAGLFARSARSSSPERPHQHAAPVGGLQVLHQGAAVKPRGLRLAAPDRGRPRVLFIS